MLKLLLTLVLVGSLGIPDQAVIADKLYDDLLAYHAWRVDSAHRHETEEARQERIRWVSDGIPRACADNADLFDTKLGWTFTQCVAFGATMATRSPRPMPTAFSAASVSSVSFFRPP